MPLPGNAGQRLPEGQPPPAALKWVPSQGLQQSPRHPDSSEHSPLPHPARESTILQHPACLVLCVSPEGSGIAGAFQAGVPCNCRSTHCTKDLESLDGVLEALNKPTAWEASQTTPGLLSPRVSPHKPVKPEKSKYGFGKGGTERAILRQVSRLHSEVWVFCFTLCNRSCKNSLH